MQPWGHSTTSGRLCVPACLQVPLISSSFPEPPSGTLIHSWWGWHKGMEGFCDGLGERPVVPQSIHFRCQLKLVPLYHGLPLGVDSSADEPVSDVLDTVASWVGLNTLFD